MEAYGRVKGRYVDNNSLFWTPLGSDIRGDMVDGLVMTNLGARYLLNCNCMEKWRMILDLC